MRGLGYVFLLLAACSSSPISPSPADVATEDADEAAVVTPLDAAEAGRPIQLAPIVEDNPWGDCTPRTWRSAKTLATEFFPPREGSRDSLSVLMADGKVVLGEAGAIWDPIADSYEVLPFDTEYRFYGTGTLLADKRTVLYAGGGFEDDAGTKRTYLFDYVEKTIKPGPPMLAARVSHRAFLLPNGKVLAVGGRAYPGGVLPGAELYDPVANTWTASGGKEVEFTGYNLAAVLLRDGKVLVPVSEGGSGQEALPPTQMGSIDREDVQKMVEEVLEGGKEAFERRRLKYEFRR